MRRVLLIILVFISLLALFIRFGSKPLFKALGLQPRAGLRIESTPKTLVSVNNKSAGQTPYQDENLTEGEYLVSLQPDLSGATSSAQTPAWQGYVKLTGGTLTVVNRELGQTPTQSSGEIISLNQGNGATVVTTPQGADITVDGKQIGKSPLSLPDLSAGEHQFLISKDNYLKRSIRATVVDNFNLNLIVDLALSEADLTNTPAAPVDLTKKVIVKSTPTGFLNVRSTPSTAGQIIAQVKPKDELVLLEELPNWDRVRLSDSKEGYVSSSFVEKKSQ